MTYEQWKRGKKTAGEAYTNEGSKIWSVMRQDVSARVRAKVEEMLPSAHGRAGELWRKYENDLTLADPVNKDKHGVPNGAFFRRYNTTDGPRGVYLTAARSLENISNRGTLATWFHEFGHNIDNLVDGIRGTYFSHTHNGGEFAATLRDEVDSHIRAKQAEVVKRETERANALPFEQVADVRDLYRRGVITWRQYNTHSKRMAEYGKIRDKGIDQTGMDKAEYNRVTREGKKSEQALRKAIAKDASRMEVVYREMGREITRGGLDTQLAVGDIFEGSTNGRCQDTYGHGGKSYWDTRGEHLSTEAFAEFFSAECIYSERPEVLDKMIEMLPKSYEAYRRLVEEALK
jgi:hypothetical protein